MKNEERLNEKCAVFGVSLHSKEAVGVTYNGLLSLQHRGQEGAGIAAVHENGIYCKKSIGLVSEIYSKDSLKKFPQAHIAVGHTRYSTTGGNTIENTGPFVTEYLTGRIVTAHNGNITNARILREELRSNGLSFSASSDTEVLSSLIAYQITKEENFLEGIKKAVQSLQGAFSLVIASGDGTLIAVRDPSGYRPLCIGESESGIAFSSESCALEACGFQMIRDVLPGEILIAENGKIVSSNIFFQNNDVCRGLCIFEFVYFARPDSVLDGLSVYEARYNMGKVLAEEYPVDADIVCGVPDSGLEAASGYSAYSGLPFVSGFVKNRYIGRSFIYPTQSQRDDAVRLKLNPLTANVAGKKVVLVDDSIVRGTTCARIIKNLRKAGASQVHMRVSSPPFVHTCHYGTDIDSEENLIANNMTMEEIRMKIGADSLGYISVSGLKRACEKCETSFCTACFTGNDTSETVRKNILE